MGRQERLSYSNLGRTFFTEAKKHFSVKPLPGEKSEIEKAIVNANGGLPVDKALYINLEDRHLIRVVDDRRGALFFEIQPRTEETDTVTIAGELVSKFNDPWREQD